MDASIYIQNNMLMRVENLHSCIRQCVPQKLIGFSIANKYDFFFCILIINMAHSTPGAVTSVYAVRFY